MEPFHPFAPRRGPAAALCLAALILAGGAYLRIVGMARYPLWLDEAYSAYAAGHGWRFLWQVVPRYETHPPFYYSLLRLWTLLFGDDLRSLRALGVAAALASLPAIALAARELARTLQPGRAGFAVPLTALLLGGLSPCLIAMAHQVRPYPVMILVYAVACLALLRLGRETAAGGGVHVKPLGFYLATLALMLWLHNMGPLYAVAMTLALAALVLRRGMSRRDWLLLVGGHVLVGLVYLPGFLILVDQAPTWVHSTWLHFTTHNLKSRLASIYAVPTPRGLAAALALGALGIAALAANDAGRRAAAALVLLGAVPVALSIGISLYATPVFIERTMAAAAVPGVLLMAAALGRRALRWPAWAALALLAPDMATIDWRRTYGVPWDDWYGAVRWVDARFRPGDQLFAYPNEGALPFDYAARDLKLVLPDRPIPTAVPAFDSGGWYPTGSRGVVSLPRSRLRAIADAPAAQAIPTIWLLRVGAATYDKDDVFLEELGRDRDEIAHYDHDPIDIIGLRRRAAPPAPAATPGRAAPAGAAAAR